RTTVMAVLVSTSGISLDLRSRWLRSATARRAAGSMKQPPSDGGFDFFDHTGASLVGHCFYSRGNKTAVPPVRHSVAAKQQTPPYAYRTCHQCCELFLQSRFAPVSPLWRPRRMAPRLLMPLNPPVRGSTPSFNGTGIF